MQVSVTVLNIMNQVMEKEETQTFGNRYTEPHLINWSELNGLVHLNLSDWCRE